MNNLICYLLMLLVGSTCLAAPKEIFDHLPELELQSATATSLRVIYMPWTISTIRRVTPELLTQLQEYEFRNSANDSQPTVVKEFVKTINGSNFRESSGDDIDCRWAFTLGDSNSKNTTTIYFNAGLSEGFAFGRKFDPDESFQRWVRQRFGAAFSLDMGN